MILRPYQVECVEAVEGYWKDNPAKNAAVSLPTGAGKTVIMAEIARRAVARGERVAIIVDRDELVKQTIDKLAKADPLMFVGVVKASRNEVSAEVVVCSIQTLRRPGRAEAILPRGVVIYDEAHGSASPSAINVMNRLNTIGDGAKAVGFSATFYRADGKPLDVIWDDVVCEKSILWAVTEGYLTDARGLSVPIEGLDLSNVKKSGGDYLDSDLAQKMLDARAAEQIADAYVENASDRIAICFAPTLGAADAITDQLTARGVAAETVKGSTGTKERERMYAALESGKIQVLCSVAVLTTGFDSPRVDCVIMARPTESQGLYVQCVGRGLRLFPGKEDCLIMDMTGTHEDQSLIGLPNLAGKVKREGSLKQMAAGGGFAEQGPRGLRANLRSKSEFDPFARKSLPWNTTHGGVKFVSTGKNGAIFIRETADGLMRVGRVNTRSAPGHRDGKWLTGPLLPEFALPEAEGYATDEGVKVSKSDLKSMDSAPPSVGQVGYATRLGVESPESLSRGQLSRAIDRAIVSRVLD